MNLAYLLDRRARVSPQAPALLLGTTLLATYAQFAARAFAFGRALRERHGLATGDRVALLMANAPEYLEVLYGAWAAGLVVVPVNAKLHPAEVAYCLADSGARLLVADDELAGPLQALMPGLRQLETVILPGSPDYLQMVVGEPLAEPLPVAPDDVAWIFYTSGTTGRPKGAMQSHRNLLTMTLAYLSDVDTVDARDAMVYAAPISHGAGMYNFVHVLAGARHVVPTSRSFDAAEMFALAASLGRVSSFAAPTMVRRLVDHADRSGASCDGFRTLVYGGGPMYVADIRRALDIMGPRFVQIYGQGECPMTITALPRSDIVAAHQAGDLVRLGSVGFAHAPVQVKVVDIDGKQLPAGEAGEVVVAGDVVMRGYWNNPQSSADALRGGWLHTGDVGVLDADGYLTLKDRSKDVIISGGSNIYPREVEEVLLLHPGIREVAVVGRDDAEWGEAVVAVAVRAPGIPVTESELDALCLERIARFKRPKAYLFVDELPKNNYGKVLKRELRPLVAAMTT